MIHIHLINNLKEVKVVSSSKTIPRIGERFSASTIFGLFALDNDGVLTVMFVLLLFFKSKILIRNYILLTKLSWPGDSKGAFRSLNQLPPVHQPTILSLPLLNVKQESCKYQF